jgi:hypothetical protein
MAGTAASFLNDRLGMQSWPREPGPHAAGWPVRAGIIEAGMSAQVLH